MIDRTSTLRDEGVQLKGRFQTGFKELIVPQNT